MAPAVRRLRATSAALLLVVGVGAALGATPSPAAHAAPTCPDAAGLEPNIWTGEVSNLWHDDDNWSLGYPPGVDDGGTGYACILSGEVRLDGPADVRNVQALHLGPEATLYVSGGAQLFVRGDPGRMTSSIARGGELNVQGSTFGGQARVNVAGTVVWHSNDSGPIATFATRPCAVAEPDPDTSARTASCNGPGGGRLDRPGGLLHIKRTGTLTIDGAGVALVDGYQLDVEGLVDVSGAGYIAADRGTGTAIEHGGVFRFRNDGGYYDGEARFGATKLSTFVNDGLLVKTDGDGDSAVDASYRQLGGHISIKSGTLSVSSGTPLPARVGPGTSYGSGQCRHAGGTFGCRPRTDSVDVQNAALRVPSIDRDGADVIVSEFDKDPHLFSIGAPVEVHSGDLDATKRHPAILSFRYDRSLLAPAQSWQNIRILRNHDNTGYRLVHRCDDHGLPPKGEQACVDKRNIPGVSSRIKAGDVIMVVRATGTSRWIAR